MGSRGNGVILTCAISPDSRVARAFTALDPTPSTPKCANRRPQCLAEKDLVLLWATPEGIGTAKYSAAGRGRHSLPLAAMLNICVRTCQEALSTFRVLSVAISIGASAGACRFGLRQGRSSPSNAVICEASRLGWTRHGSSETLLQRCAVARSELGVALGMRAGNAHVGAAVMPQLSGAAPATWAVVRRLDRTHRDRRDVPDLVRKRYRARRGRLVVGSQHPGARALWWATVRTWLSEGARWPHHRSPWHAW